MYDFYDPDSLVFTAVKLKISGNIVELSKFGKAFPVGQRPKLPIARISKPDFQSLTDDEKIEELENKIFIRKKSLRRADRRVTDLINANVFAYKDENDRTFPPVFLTLTYSENVTDLKVSNTNFINFIKRLNFFILGEQTGLRYVSVIEFQKRGAVHYHAIFFNLPYIHFTKLTELWGHGNIDVKLVRSIKNLGRYVTKYMTKDFSDPRLEGHQAYLASKKLIKPSIIYYEELVNLLARDFPDEAVENISKIDVKFLGSMETTRYNMLNFPKIKKYLHEEYSRYFDTPRIVAPGKATVGDNWLEKWKNKPLTEKQGMLF